MIVIAAIFLKQQFVTWKKHENHNVAICPPPPLPVYCVAPPCPLNFCRAFEKGLRTAILAYQSALNAVVDNAGLSTTVSAFHHL